MRECDRLLAETAMQTLEGLCSKVQVGLTENTGKKGSSDSEDDSSSDEDSEDEEPRLGKQQRRRTVCLVEAKFLSL